MTRDLLLEIGLEEIPSQYIRDAVHQLADKTAKWLEESRVEYREVKAYATPRRLAVLVSGVAERGQDISELVKGPSRKIALDENGQWSKAALGFARSQGVAPEQLVFQEVQGVDYVFAQKNQQGVETSQVLNEGLNQLVVSLSFPKNMRWGAKDLRYIRPIRWLVALFGPDIIPFEITGVQAGRLTRGHRFLSSGDIAISEASAYVQTLREHNVLVDMEERGQLIVQGIQQLANERGWEVPMQPDLLEEVTFLVEYPTVLFGSFDPEFLQIPQDVLITSMREHQRYFPVLDKAGQLQPFFITVRNGNKDFIDVVARGNEKVLRARLSDAKFFYQEDQKQPIDHYLQRLESIVFQEELGTIGDKVRRIEKIAESLAERAAADANVRADVQRSAHICKFDLVTQMVYEFPELQGIMGEDYARIAGEKDTVAKAIREHYQPRFSGDSSPESLAGTMVSIADKIDTIAGCFAIGIVPTGSQDPYALRRQAAGIVQMMLDHNLSLTLSTLFELAIKVYEDAGLLKRTAEEVKSDLYEFFGLRVKNLLSERGIRYDIIDAVMGSGYADISAVVRKADALTQAASQGEFKVAVESFNRVNNLAAKAEGVAEVNPDLFAEAVEHALYEAWQNSQSPYNLHMQQGQEREALMVLTELKPAITAYFDGVMIMVDDEAVRRNRLAMLQGISSEFKRFADFHKLVW